MATTTTAAKDSEEEKHKKLWCPRTAFLWLIIGLAADVIVPSTFGTVCGPHCAEPGSSGLIYFLRKAWWHGPYLFGASSFDLWVAAIGRLIAYVLLAVLRLRVTRWPAPPHAVTSISSSASPLLAPLNARPLNSDGAGTDVTSSLPSSSLPNGEVVAPWLRAKHAYYLSWALTSLTWTHGAAKGFGRLFSAGDPRYGSGLGLLPRDGTTPPELHFWACLFVALLCSALEQFAFATLSAKRSERPRANGATGEDEESASSGRGDKKSAEDAADAASMAKKRYISASEPKDVHAIRAMYRMMLPDTHLLLMAYASLSLAAFGESIVPLLYGRVIDAIAIIPDQEAFRTNLLYLIGTAAL